VLIKRAQQYALALHDKRVQVPALGSPTAPVASFEFPSTQYCTDDQVTEWIGEEVPTLTYMSMHVPDDHDHSVAMAPGPGPMAMGVMDAPHDTSDLTL
jgi:hypothetical protein